MVLDTEWASLTSTCDECDSPGREPRIASFESGKRAGKQFYVYPRERDRNQTPDTMSHETANIGTVGMDFVLNILELANRR